MINTRRAYIAALKECIRRQRADTQLHSMQSSAKRAFLEQATAERASRQVGFIVIIIIIIIIYLFIYLFVCL